MNKVLDVKSVSKRFGGVQALDDVSIHLNEGEVLALAGDNGAGKSTLIKVVSGVYHPDEGDIIFNNENIQLDNPRFAREKGIETIYQDLQKGNQVANLIIFTHNVKRTQMDKAVLKINKLKGTVGNALAFCIYN